MTDEELLDKLQDPQSRLEIILYLIYEALGSSGGGGTGTGSGGTSNYNMLLNKPKINGVILSGDKVPSDLGLDKYSSLTGKPKINGVELSDNKTTEDLKISYDDVSDRPSINNQLLTGNITLKDLGINIPTLISALTNDAGYIKDTDVNKKLEAYETITALATELSKYYTKDQVTSLLSAMLRYKGTVATDADLNALTDAKTGDVYRVSGAGFYARTEDGKWDNIGTTFVDLTEYVKRTDTATTTQNGMMSAADKQKLTNIQANAEENKIVSISVDGVQQEIDDNKNVDISMALGSQIKANVTVGGINAGTTLQKGMTFEEFLKKLLTKELAPSITFSATNSGLKEKGTSVSSTLTLNITNLGTGTPTSIEFFNGSTSLGSMDYADGTTSYTFGTAQTVTSNTTFKGVLHYKKSDGSTGDVSGSANITFVAPSYVGAVSTAPTDKTTLTALTKKILSSKSTDATFTLNDQRSCFAYPKSFGTLTSVKDSNNVDYINSYTRTELTVDGDSYYVYTLTDPVTASGFKQMFR